jgi:SNF2 family DNA or RNA helicase
VFDWVDNYLSSSGGGKLIIFSIHKVVMKMIDERYSDMLVKIDGSVSNQKRKIAVAQFNKSKHKRIMNGQLVAAGIGWSATDANITVFTELDWIPARHTQAEKRTHGLYRGIKGKKSFSYYIVAKGTIEEKMCRLLTQRQKVLDHVLDGGVASNFDLVSELIKEIASGKK